MIILAFFQVAKIRIIFPLSAKNAVKCTALLRRSGFAILSIWIANRIDE